MEPSSLDENLPFLSETITSSRQSLITNQSSPRSSASPLTPVDGTAKFRFGIFDIIDPKAFGGDSDDDDTVAPHTMGSVRGALQQSASYTYDEHHEDDGGVPQERSATHPGDVSTPVTGYWPNSHHLPSVAPPTMPSYLYRPPPFSAPAPSDPQAYAYNHPSPAYDNGHLPPMRVPAEDQTSGGWVYTANYNAGPHPHNGSFPSHPQQSNLYHHQFPATYHNAMPMITPEYVTPTLFPSCSNERGGGRDSPKVKSEPEDFSQASPLASDRGSMYEHEERPIDITYTSDSEVKVTAELKRCCYNCSATSPPSWRKSILNIGKILCNKCGIFERTHRRPRPHQPDDQKLRKSTTLLAREAPMRLHVMSDDSDGDDGHSPSSTVPSQLTPTTGTFQQSAPLLTASSLDSRRYPYPTPLTAIGSHGHGHGHEVSSSPYGYAYSLQQQRRAATFAGAIAAPAASRAPVRGTGSGSRSGGRSGSGGGAGASAGGSEAAGRTPLFSTRRYSEGFVHDSQGSE